MPGDLLEKMAGLEIRFGSQTQLLGTHSKGFEFPSKNHIQRLVRVMATQAVSEKIVITPFMALATSGNIVGTHWAVSDVAIKAIILTFMGCSSSIDFTWLDLMTLTAVLN